MTIKVNNCRDCIFRESHYNPDSMGYDTSDICLLLKKQNITAFKSYSIATYDSFEEEQPKELEQRLPNCPLDKEQIIVSL